jgi:hypothetical protein
MDDTDVKSKENVWHLAITLLDAGTRIHISKDIIRVLSFPRYVCLRINHEKNSIIIKECESTDPMSFEVPTDLFSKNVKFRISSKAFVNSVLLANGLDVDGTYTFEGEYIEEYNVVKVTIKK